MAAEWLEACIDEHELYDIRMGVLAPKVAQRNSTS